MASEVKEIHARILEFINDDTEFTSSNNHFVQQQEQYTNYHGRIHNDKQNNSKMSKKQLKKKKNYMFKRAYELAIEIYCLVHNLRTTFLYDHGAFSKIELVELIACLKLNHIYVVSIVNNSIDNSSDVEAAYFTNNTSMFLINVNRIDILIDNKTLSNQVFVDISYELKDPKRITDINVIKKYHEALNIIVKKIKKNNNDVKNNNTYNNSHVEINNKDINMMLDEKNDIDMIALQGMMLNYPIIYCISSGNNCLSNVPLTSFTISFNSQDNTINKEQQNIICYAFTCPTNILLENQKLMEEIKDEIMNRKLISCDDENHKLFKLDITNVISLNSIGV